MLLKGSVVILEVNMIRVVHMVIYHPYLSWLYVVGSTCLSLTYLQYSAKITNHRWLNVSLTYLRILVMAVIGCYIVFKITFKFCLFYTKVIISIFFILFQLVFAENLEYMSSFWKVNKCEVIKYNNFFCTSSWLLFQARFHCHLPEEEKLYHLIDSCR